MAVASLLLVIEASNKEQNAGNIMDQAIIYTAHRYRDARLSY